MPSRNFTLHSNQTRTADDRCDARTSGERLGFDDPESRRPRGCGCSCYYARAASAALKRAPRRGSAGGWNGRLRGSPGYPKPFMASARRCFRTCSHILPAIFPPVTHVGKTTRRKYLSAKGDFRKGKDTGLKKMFPLKRHKI